MGEQWALTTEQYTANPSCLGARAKILSPAQLSVKNIRTIKTFFWKRGRLQSGSACESLLRMHWAQVLRRWNGLESGSLSVKLRTSEPDGLIFYNRGQVAISLYFFLSCGYLNCCIVTFSELPPNRDFFKAGLDLDKKICLLAITSSLLCSSKSICG